MGIWEEFKKMTRPMDEDDAYEDPAPEAEAQPEPAPRTTGFSDYTAEPKSAGGFRSRGTVTGKVTNMSASSQVFMAKPERYEAVTEIADHLRQKRTVVLNLENASKDVARRLLDFLSGTAYALDGKISRVSDVAYIITPSNVEVLGELLDELENSGFYF